MGWYDLIADNMLGQQDPRKQLAAALAGQQQTQAGSVPQGQPSATPPPSADPNYANPQSSGGPGVTGGQGQGMNQPPSPTGVAATQAPVAVGQANMQGQPKAMQSPPDLVALYTALADRQQKSQQFDTGLGLLFSAFAKPADRAGMISAMSHTQPDAGGQLENAVKLQQYAQAQQTRASGIAALPGIAQQLGLPLDQVRMMFDNGSLDNLLQQSNVPTGHMKEYAEYKKDQAAQGKTALSMADWMKAQKNEEDGKYSNSGTLVRLPDGTIGMGQLNNRGEGRVANFGPGVSVVDPYDKARQVALGGAEGKAAEQLPAADNAVATGTALIDKILTTGDTKGNSGYRSLFEPYIFSSSGETANNIDQLKNINFLQAYTQLRGAGNISDAEGIKAQSAFANLQHPERLSDAAFRQNLQDAKDAMVKANIAAHKAAGDKTGGPNAPPPSGSNPAPAGGEQPTDHIPTYNRKTRKFE